IAFDLLYRVLATFRRISADRRPAAVIAEKLLERLALTHAKARHRELLERKPQRAVTALDDAPLRRPPRSKPLVERARETVHVVAVDLAYGVRPRREDAARSKHPRRFRAKGVQGEPVQRLRDRQQGDRPGLETAAPGSSEE